MGRRAAFRAEMDCTEEPRYKARMKRSSSVLMLLVSGSLLFAACKKSEDPTPVPIPSGAATPTPVGGDAPAMSATTAATATVAPVPVAPVAVAPVNAQPIDSCCSALAATSKSGRGADAKSKSALASKICSGISPLVKSGKTTRASALTTIRAQLAGVEIPSECR
jgi:hypothetical protein